MKTRPKIGQRILACGLRDQDLLECLDVQPRRIGEESVGRTRAIQIWKELIHSRSFSSIVIEAHPPIGGHAVVRFGASVFVSPVFAQTEIRNPRPGLNARIIESMACGHPVILTEFELRSTNTEGELDLVILYSSFRTEILSPREMFEGYQRMTQSGVDLHVGYRLNQVIDEAVGETERYLHDVTHVWHVISNYHEFYRGIQTPGFGFRTRIARARAVL